MSDQKKNAVVFRRIHGRIVPIRQASTPGHVPNGKLRIRMPSKPVEVKFEEPVRTLEVRPFPVGPVAKIGAASALLGGLGLYGHRLAQDVKLLGGKQAFRALRKRNNYGLNVAKESVKTGAGHVADAARFVKRHPQGVSKTLVVGGLGAIGYSIMKWLRLRDISTTDKL
jgi:hypothetical protein